MRVKFWWIQSYLKFKIRVFMSPLQLFFTIFSKLVKFDIIISWSTSCNKYAWNFNRIQSWLKLHTFFYIFPKFRSLTSLSPEGLHAINAREILMDPIVIEISNFFFSIFSKFRSLTSLSAEVLHAIITREILMESNRDWKCRLQIHLRTPPETPRTSQHYRIKGMELGGRVLHEIGQVKFYWNPIII